MKDTFVINILDMYWIDGSKDNPDDLCLHGDIYVRIGEEVVADKYSCILSSTALYSLKSLSKDHKIGESANHMLPCCGHTIIPDEKEDIVEIMGCPNGVDWNVFHCGDFVKLNTQNGTEAMIDLDLYREIVFKFVDEVEEFYKKSVGKNIPTDIYDRDGYEKFWKEWHARRDYQR